MSFPGWEPPQKHLEGFAGKKWGVGDTRSPNLGG